MQFALLFGVMVFFMPSSVALIEDIYPTADGSTEGVPIGCSGGNFQCINERVLIETPPDFSDYVNFSGILPKRDYYHMEDLSYQGTVSRIDIYLFYVQNGGGNVNTLALYDSTEQVQYAIAYIPEASAFQVEDGRWVSVPFTGLSIPSSAVNDMKLRINCELECAVVAMYAGVNYDPQSENNQPVFNQAAYRFFENTNSSGVGAPLAGQDVVAKTPMKGIPFRLRLLIDLAQAGLPAAAGPAYLQVAEKVGECDVNFDGEDYSYVSTSSGDIRFYDNDGVSNGAALTPNANDPSYQGHSVVTQSYIEDNPFYSLSEVPAGSSFLIDYSLVDYSSGGGSNYCFRLVGPEGNILDTYTAVAEIQTALDILAVEFVDSSGSAVANPVVDFGVSSVSFDEQYVGAELGTTNQRIRVINGRNEAMWTLTLQAKNGPSALWLADSNGYDFNDAGGEGFLEVDPSGAVISSVFPANSANGLNRGSSAVFSQGVLDFINIASASNTADAPGIWEFTGIDLMQMIPAGQVSGNYSIDFILTVI